VRLAGDGVQQSQEIPVHRRLLALHLDRDHRLHDGILRQPTVGLGADQGTTSLSSALRLITTSAKPGRQSTNAEQNPNADATSRPTGITTMKPESWFENRIPGVPIAWRPRKAPRRQERERDQQNARILPRVGCLSGRPCEHRGERAHASEHHEVKFVIRMVGIEVLAEQEREEADQRQRSRGDSWRQPNGRRVGGGEVRGDESAIASRPSALIVGRQRFTISSTAAR
jgi:hypothetical protein